MVKQGCVLAPNLFNQFINHLNKIKVNAHTPKRHYNFRQKLHNQAGLDSTSCESLSTGDSVLEPPVDKKTSGYKIQISEK